MIFLASIHIGPIQFDQPVWLFLIPIAWALAVWMARSSLSGLGTTARRVALLVRLIVILLLVAAVATPSWRRQAKNVVVSVVLDESRSVPLPLQQQAGAYLKEASKRAKQGDQQATVTLAREAYVRALPGPPGAERSETQSIADRDGTDLAEGSRLAMAVMPQDRVNRMVLFSDGNETAGNLLLAAEAARAAGVPIDVFVYQYRYDREVVMERLVAPATARMGETVNLRLLLNSTTPTRGKLSLLVNGEPLDLDPDSAATARVVTLEAGVNPLSIQVPFHKAGAQKIEAVFEPLPDETGQIGDSIPENNRQEAITFVSGQGRVLVLAPTPEEAAPLLKAMEESHIDAEARAPENAPPTLVELGVFDAVILANVSADKLQAKQQEDLKNFVHDLGGGLIMLGGPDSFGAGGWIGSPLADALPVKMDPPQKRQMPKGALVLMMHSCEMPNGNYWGKQTALAAVNNLSSQDLAGIVEYGWQAGGAEWVHPLSPVGDKIAITRAINSLAYGDAPSFDAFMRLAIPDLEKCNAGLKHAIFISDGDPQPPSRPLIQRYLNAKVSVSTVAVFPHSNSPNGQECTMMKEIATLTGGNFYYVNSANIGNLPNIFIKEAQTVRRTLIWEGNPFTPAATNTFTEAMRGIPTPVPQISGYVVTGDREGLNQVSLRAMENDPLLASWQFGLGKSIAYTSDATTRWSQSWTTWGSFRAFWEQHIRWVMRPSGSADVRVTTEDRGDSTLVTIEALDAKGERLNFLDFKGRVVKPDSSSDAVQLRQVGPGRYQGSFKSDKSGSYVLNYHYNVPAADGSQPQEGTVQAAVSRPFADEFRSLRDNAALMRQVAALTGGRVLTGDPEKDDLWTRAGLKMPITLWPIWLWVACGAIGLFLMDVAVRRVRIDVPAMARAVRKGLSARRERRAGQQMASLREARERAQQAMAQRASQPAAPQAPGAGTNGEPVPVAGASKNVKFEASEDELAAAKGGLASDVAAAGGGKPAGPDKSSKPATTSTQPKPGDAEGLSRLMKAKKRAQDQMEQD